MGSPAVFEHAGNADSVSTSPVKQIPMSFARFRSTAQDSDQRQFGCEQISYFVSVEPSLGHIFTVASLFSVVRVQVVVAARDQILHHITGVGLAARSWQRVEATDIKYVACLHASERQAGHIALDQECPRSHCRRNAPQPRPSSRKGDYREFKANYVETEASEIGYVRARATAHVQRRALRQQQPAVPEGLHFGRRDVRVPRRAPVRVLLLPPMPVRPMG